MDEVVRSSGSVELRSRRACRIVVSSSDLFGVALLEEVRKVQQSNGPTLWRGQQSPE